MPIAQSAEQRTFNPRVLGSIPNGHTSTLERTNKVKDENVFVILLAMIVAVLVTVLYMFWYFQNCAFVPLADAPALCMVNW